MELDVIRGKDRTEVGSYFIATYPPFSAWSADHLPVVGALLDADPRSGASADATPLGLYLHIPFCRKRCKFCYFRVYTDKNSSQIEDYLEALATETTLYAQKKALAGRRLDFVYFGGGTPSYLSNEQLLRLVERISKSWTWDTAREVTFECEPGTLKESKLQTLRDIGVTRLSLGIEHFDDQVLELNGRAHHSAEIYRAFEWARHVGFPQINIDLIAGMVGDDDAKWQETVEKALALRPDSLTIYQMELPFNTVFSQEWKDAPNQVKVADWSTKRRWVAQAFEEFEAAGYVVSSGYTLVDPKVHQGFVYRDALWHGADMIGCGVASFSHCGGMHFQNLDQWDDYLGSLSAGLLPVSRGMPTTPRQRLIREMVLQLKLGWLDPGYFEKKFGVDIIREFSEQWQGLAGEGYCKTTLAENGSSALGSIELTREGLLRVDSLLPRFFEPEYRNVRYT